MVRTNVVLLGSGYPPTQKNFRRKLTKSLRSKKINPVTMEAKMRKKDYSSLISEFNKILGMYKKKLIVALFTKRGVHDAVYFELGFIAHKYGAGLKKMLLILVDDTIKHKKISRYLTRGLYLKANINFFDSSKNADRLDKPQNIILQFISSNL